MIPAAMASREPARHGVYFARADHVGFWRRLVIESVDLAVAAVACVVIGGLIVLVSDLEPDEDVVLAVVYLSALPMGVAYFVLLKRFGRTAGYWACRARIVTLAGDRPGLWLLFVRFLFAVLGPLNFALDLLWIPSDESRQALRDKFAGTYVVGVRARPAGHGRLTWAQYHVLGATFVFREVERPPEGRAS
jgi:uncharacterized RDD family membrane protein YckC